ncbi:nitrilase-related carbon-nitrogen hydrolase [Streptomyces sp. NBC_01320]|uniref:nitrilase-related carbon-nitrogen hydrolase n=1 Tax=Streptomyces sp. NBC_01320 TaxID=2903824 RepID=UPI002E1210AB|nr:hypothetical protein OG395_07445 [Streptomyces sp. NBC_01320]
MRHLEDFPRFTAAAVQTAPIYLDAAATVDKAVALIHEAAGHGARLIAFPEVFVPGYRSWAVSRSESWLTGTPRTVLGALVLRFRVPVGDAYPVCGPSRAGGIPTTWPYGCGQRRRGGPEPSRW